MIDFLVKNRELVVAIASVIVAILGVVAALLKRNTSHTIRHETVTHPSASPNSGTSRQTTATSENRATGVSIAGDFLCVGNDTIHRSQITGVTLGRGFSGAVSLVAAPLFALLALGGWTNGDYGIAIMLGVMALMGASVASMKNVYVTTPQGPRRIGKSLFPGEADRMRREILSWRSG
jgi:hypothetical protein